MSFWSTFLRGAALFLLTAVLSGCLPGSSDNVDEQKDPHFIKGRNLASSLDYKGAIDEFEKAIEANPRSSQAHFEVGLLYGEQIKDYAAAIYHLQQHLKLSPNSGYLERCNERIKTYKIELVKTEYVAPMNLGVQRQMEQLTTENTMLKKQIELMQAQLATREVLATNPLAGVRGSVANYSQAGGAAVANPRNPVPSPQPAPAPPSRSRTHTVRSGDTFMSIAKEHGVKVNALQQANPGIDSRRLKVGQTLNLPQS